MKVKSFLLISSFIFLSCKDSTRNVDLTTVSKIDTVVEGNNYINNKEKLINNSTSNKDNSIENYRKSNKEVNINRKIDKRLIVVFEGKIYYKKNFRDEPYRFCPEDKPSKIIFYDVIRKKYYDIRTNQDFIVYEQGRPCRGENVITEPIIKETLKEVIVIKDSTKK